MLINFRPMTSNLPGKSSADGVDINVYTQNQNAYMCTQENAEKNFFFQVTNHFCCLVINSPSFIVAFINFHTLVFDLSEI